MLHRITCALAVLCTAVLSAVAPAPSLKSWVEKLESRGIRVTAGVWDLQTGKLIEGHQTDLALVPASTTKVVSTYAILKSWKPNREIETELWGDLKGGIVRGDLVFKGAGDPSLVNDRIWVLAQELKAKGVVRVQGRVRLDQSAFDDQVYGDGWANTTSDTTPPILPLSVNHNRENRRIVRDPERLAVEIITRILQEAGITVEGARLPPGELQKIHTHTSLPLRQMIQDINKFSNNFSIEMLVKCFGDGTWPRGIARIQDFYKAVLELGPDKIAITDGSGLSKDNRLSARTLAIVLRAGWNDFEVGPEFVSSLKIIGGEPWALNIQDANLVRRIRCKTGELTSVNSVCGYLQTLDGRLRVFAIILNGECRKEDLWEMVSRWAN